MPDITFPRGVTLQKSADLKLMGDDGTQPGDVPASMFLAVEDAAEVAKTGSWNDLLDKPDLSGVGGGGAGILSGTTAPANSLGTDGAFYLRTGASPSLYGPKAGGSWPAPVSLVGPAGAGGGMLTGTTAPVAGQGADGQFYLQSGANPVLWGPKTAGAWPAPGISLVGPQGIQGAAGSLTGVEELTLPNGTIVASNSAGQFIGLANVRMIPLGIDMGAPVNGQVFKGPPMPFPFKVLGVYGRIEGTGGPSVTGSLKIGSTDVTGLAAKAYTAATVARQNATGANTGSVESEISFTVTAAPVGTVTRAAFYVIVEQGAAS